MQQKTEEQILTGHYSRSIDFEWNTFNQSLCPAKSGAFIKNERSGDNVSYTRPTRVTVNAGGKIYIIDADGIAEIEGEPTKRGVSIFLQYSDEESGGHVYEHHIQFHKGITYNQTDILAKIKIEEATEQEFLETGDTFIVKNEPIEGFNKEVLADRVIWRD